MIGGSITIEESYLEWLAAETPTTWWHDSADPGELPEGLVRSEVGVTTNPVLASVTLRSSAGFWAADVGQVAADLTPALRAEALILMGIVVRYAAQQVLPVFQETGGRSGYVCAQVDPARAGDGEAMLAMGRRFAAWAPNIAVKLPATAADFDVAEELAAEGATVTITVSFTVPQVLAAAERHRLGVARARQAGKEPGRCFAVIMVGRLDDYLRDIALDRQAAVSEEDIRQGSLAVVKRAYSLFQEHGYEATLLVAALRGVHHVTELAGGRLILSVHPNVQSKLFAPDLPRQERIDLPVDEAAISRMESVPDFVRSYEPDGMRPEDFASFGLTQRTLTQFSEAGWKLLAALK